MHFTFPTALLALSSVVSGATLPQRDTPPALPVSEFAKTSHKGKTLEELRVIASNETAPAPSFKTNLVMAAATCANPRIRTEWDGYSTASRQNFVNAIKCLMNKAPSGQFSNSKNRYEDIVAVHQRLTPNVHGNNKFLLWHRFYLWAFEQILRDECGFTAELPWFDESRYAGKFSQSSVFSSQWFGAIALGGGCVNNGQFAGITLNVGPGTSNQRHCLSRDGDASETINTGKAMVDMCNSYNNYPGMAACAEGGAHAWGHNGIGGVMQDVYASPADPVFWLHHAFIDHNYRMWQGKDSSRASSISGTDGGGNALTLQTGINLLGLRPDVKIGDILDTLGTKLCYKYNY